MKLCKHSLNKIVFLSGSVIFPNVLLAAAYQDWEQSAMGAGMAHADMAAGALDASTAYYNPAGMTLIDEPQISVGGIYVNEDTTLSNIYVDETSNYGPKTIGALPDVHSNFTRVIPNVNVVYPVESLPFETTVGLAVNSSGGASTYYKHTELNNYARTTTAEVLLINPSVAFEIFDGFSIGGGWDLQEFKSRYSIGDIPGSTPANHINGNAELSSWENSWNIGVLYEWTDDTRFGATYRSKAVFSQFGQMEQNISLHGTVPIDVTGVGSDVFSEIKMPAITTFGAYHDLNDRLSLMTTIGYIQWDIVDSVTVENASFVGIAPLNSTVPMHLENTWFASIGGQYDFTKRWVGRLGFSYDQTPTQDEYREMHMPDSDRYTFAAGLGYQITKYTRLDASYQYVYTPSVNFANYAEIIDQPKNAGHVSGDAQSHANLIGLQLTWNFCCSKL